MLILFPVYVRQNTALRLDLGYIGYNKHLGAAVLPPPYSQNSTYALPDFIILEAVTTSLLYGNLWMFTERVFCVATI